MISDQAWEEAELGEIASASSNEMPGDDALVWNLSLEDIQSQTGRILKRQTCRVSDLGSSKCSFDERHVLYSKLRPYLNKVVVPDEAGVGTSELIPLVPDSSRISREYLAFYLRSPNFVDFANRNSRGANLPRISMKALWKHKIQFPRAIDEQQRIVDRITSCIDRIEQAISLVQKSRDEIDELKRTLVMGQDVSDRDWCLVSEVADWIQESEAVSQGTEYHFAGIKSFGRGLFAREIRTSEDFAYSTLRRLRTGDFIYPKLMAWEGAFAMVTNEFDGFVVSPEFVVFRAKSERVSCEVLDAYFRSPVCLDDVRSASTGSNRRRRRLSPKAFLNLRLPVPNQSIQAKLKDVYSYESRTRRETSEREPKLKALRDAILRKAFAGEL